MNSTIVPEALRPIPLVYGVIPLPARCTPCLTQVKRARTIEEATLQSEKYQAKKRLSFGLSHHPEPKGSENTNDLKNLPAGLKVLVHRTTTKTSKVPHTLVSTYGETLVVEMKRSRSILRSPCVNPTIAPPHSIQMTTHYLNATAPQAKLTPQIIPPHNTNPRPRKQRRDSPQSLPAHSSAQHPARPRWTVWSETAHSYSYTEPTCPPTSESSVRGLSTSSSAMSEARGRRVYWFHKSMRMMAPDK